MTGKWAMTTGRINKLGIEWVPKAKSGKDQRPLQRSHDTLQCWLFLAVTIITQSNQCSCLTKDNQIPIHSKHNILQHIQLNTYRKVSWLSKIPTVMWKHYTKIYRSLLPWKQSSHNRVLTCSLVVCGWRYWSKTINRQ